jgi:CRP/FNR family cyclic AMP-dependent transcriptional regulator
VTDQDFHRLEDIRLFRGFDDDWLRGIERQCHWQSFDVDDNILDRDNIDSDVYFVTRGSVLIVNFSQSGREIALARIAAGSYFGELAAIDGDPRSASEIALEPCVVGALTPNVFNDIVNRDPTLSARLMRRLARIIRTSDDRIMDLSTLGAHQRVYLELLHISEIDPANSGALLIGPMPAQKDIASQASTTRETVTRAISQLVADGIAERKQKSLYIHDRTRFEHLASALDPDWGEESAR